MIRATQLYEIINPLDPYSISSTSEVHAAAAVIFLAEGHFGMRRRYGARGRLVGNLVFPPETFSDQTFGKAALELWWQQRPESRRGGGHELFLSWCARELRGIADALETVKLEAASPTRAEDVAHMARALAAEFRRGVALRACGSQGVGA